MVNINLDNFNFLTEQIKESTFREKGDKEKLEKIIEKVKDKEEKLDEKDIDFLREIKDPNRHVKEISRDAIGFSKELHTRSTVGFLIVMIMYVVAFAFGVALLASALHFAWEGNKTELAAIFGLIGSGDMAFLLYRPAREIIKSRGSATQLLSIFKELQFISIWSGKTYGKLYDKIEIDKNGIKPEAFEQMIALLKLKAELTIKFVKTIEEYVKNGDKSNDSSQDETSKENEVKKIKLDKENYSKATGNSIDKLDYSNLQLVKQEKDFKVGEDKNKGKGSSEKFWTAKMSEEEMADEPKEGQIETTCEKVTKPDKPSHKCSQGSDWQPSMEWYQWSLFKQKNEKNWRLRCYHNIQWQCGKKPSQVESKNEG